MTLWEIIVWKFYVQSPVVQGVHNAINWKNHYPVDRVVCFIPTYAIWWILSLTLWTTGPTNGKTAKEIFLIRILDASDSHTALNSISYKPVKCKQIIWACFHSKHLELNTLSDNLCWYFLRNLGVSRNPSLQSFSLHKPYCFWLLKTITSSKEVKKVPFDHEIAWACVTAWNYLFHVTVPRNGKCDEYIHMTNPQLQVTSRPTRPSHAIALHTILWKQKHGYTKLLSCSNFVPIY